MDIFDFEELMSDVLGVTDEQREDDDFLRDAFFDKFEIDFDLSYDLAKTLLMRTPIVEAGISKKRFHAFVSKDRKVMLMTAAPVKTYEL